MEFPFEAQKFRSNFALLKFNANGSWFVLRGTHSIYTECTIRDGCKRNPTEEFIKTAKKAPMLYLTHVAENRQRLRPGKRNKSKHSNDISLKLNHFVVFLVIMTLSTIGQRQKVNAASLHDDKSIKHQVKNVTKVKEKELLNEICSMEVKWENACGGQWEEDSSNRNMTKIRERVPHYHILKPLKSILLTTYNELKARTPEIDISQTNTTWRRHKEAYKFLPQLRPNSTLKLRKLHRQTQIYAGAFTYLRRAQLNFETRRSWESGISRTLKKFELAALHILCEIEATINKTSTINRPLRYVKPQRMRRVLKLRTDMKQFYSESCSEDLRSSIAELIVPADSIDLRFAKKQFLSFLRSMRQIVKRKIQTRGNLNTSDSTSDNNASFSKLTSPTSAASKQESDLLNLSDTNSSKSFERNKRRHGIRRHHRKLFSDYPSNN